MAEKIKPASKIFFIEDTSNLGYDKLEVTIDFKEHPYNDSSVELKQGAGKKNIFISHEQMAQLISICISEGLFDQE